MKKNTFYLLIGCLAIALLVIFWYAVENDRPFITEIAFVVAVGIAYLARQKVTDFVEDERSARITEKAALRTLQVFWVVFFAFSIGQVTSMLQVPEYPRPFRPPDLPDLPGPRIIGYIQLGLLCLMIFLYVGFRYIMTENSGNGFLMKNKIKVFRAMNDITQEELAIEMGVTRQTILAIENEKYDPSLHLAAKIAKYFRARIDEVFMFDSEP